MNSELLAKWTSTITNMAVVIGLVFVGLEFRNTTKAIEADRVDSITQAIIGNNTLLLQTEGLSELLFDAYARPEELTPEGLDKLQSYWYVTYSQFAQVHQAYRAGLISEEQWQFQEAAAGFGFSSKPGLAYVEIMRASEMDSATWALVYESALSAFDYCQAPENLCTARYEVPFDETDGR